MALAAATQMFQHCPENLLLDASPATTGRAACAGALQDGLKERPLAGHQGVAVAARASATHLWAESPGAAPAQRGLTRATGSGSSAGGSKDHKVGDNEPTDGLEPVYVRSAFPRDRDAAPASAPIGPAPAFGTTVAPSGAAVRGAATPETDVTHNLAPWGLCAAGGCGGLGGFGFASGLPGNSLDRIPGALGGSQANDAGQPWPNHCRSWEPPDVPQQRPTSPFGAWQGVLNPVGPCMLPASGSGAVPPDAAATLTYSEVAPPWESTVAATGSPSMAPLRMDSGSALPQPTLGVLSSITGGDVVSRGTLGHPDSCGLPCKFSKKPNGCKDGMDCPRCHACKWTKGAEHQKKMRLYKSSTQSAAVASLAQGRSVAAAPPPHGGKGPPPQLPPPPPPSPPPHL